MNTEQDIKDGLRIADVLDKRDMPTAGIVIRRLVAHVRAFSDLEDAIANALNEDEQNDISDEYRVLRGEVLRCTRCGYVPDDPTETETGLCEVCKEDAVDAPKP